jgi:outer membrane protein assembly factor BamD
MKSTLFSLLLVTLCSLLLSACASGPSQETTEQALYDEARKAIRLRNFNTATLALEDLESKFPFGKYAEQAQLDLIYARYSSLDLEGSILAAERFIRLHPQSPNVDYAYYVKGIANYYLDAGLARQYFTMVDVSSRDPGNMRQAFRDFEELLTRYPKSQYAADARQRMIEIRNRLARYELHAAQYYIQRQSYIAAANRAAFVVERFSQTPAVEDALILMVELYRLLELTDQEADALAILKLNFPAGKGFDQAGNFQPQMIQQQTRSLASVITFGLLD